MKSTNETNWRDHAACKGLPVNTFFPTAGESASRAQAVCAGCPVTQACHEASLDGSYGDVEHGVWAGTGYRGRRKHRIAVRGRKQAGNQPKPINHGTQGGYRTHYRRNDLPACYQCRDAHARHQAAWRAGRRAAA